MQIFSRNFDAMNSLKKHLLMTEEGRKLCFFLNNSIKTNTNSH